MLDMDVVLYGPVLLAEIAVVCSVDNVIVLVSAIVTKEVTFVVEVPELTGAVPELEGIVPDRGTDVKLTLVLLDEDVVKPLDGEL